MLKQNLIAGVLVVLSVTATGSIPVASANPVDDLLLFVNCSGSQTAGIGGGHFWIEGIRDPVQPNAEYPASWVGQDCPEQGKYVCTLSMEPIGHATASLYYDGLQVVEGEWHGIVFGGTNRAGAILDHGNGSCSGFSANIAGGILGLGVATINAYAERMTPQEIADGWADLSPP